MSTEAEILEREISKKLATAEKSLEDLKLKQDVMHNKKVELQRDIKDLKKKLKEASYLNIDINVGECYLLDQRDFIESWSPVEVMVLYKVLAVQKGENSVLVLKTSVKACQDDCTTIVKVTELKLNKFSDLLKQMPYKKISEKKYKEWIALTSEAFLETHPKLLRYNDYYDPFKVDEED